MDIRLSWMLASWLISEVTRLLLYYFIIITSGQLVLISRPLISGILSSHLGTRCPFAVVCSRKVLWHYYKLLVSKVTVAIRYI